MIRTLTIIGLAVLCIAVFHGTTHFATSAHAEAGSSTLQSICNSIAKGNLKDQNYSFSDEEHYNELKSVLKNSHLKSYQQWQSDGQSMGLNIPVDDLMIGFDAAAQSNSGQFQQEMNDFLNSNYSQVRSRATSITNSDVFNTQMVSVIDHCVAAASYANPGTYVSAIANSASDFSVRVRVVRYSEAPGQAISLTGIVPSTVTCKLANGQPAKAGTPIPQSEILMECTKSEAQTISGFIVQTSAGASDAVKLPAKKALEANLPPLVKTASWSPTAPMGPPPPAQPCSCVAFHNQGHISVMQNFCKETVVIRAQHDPDASKVMQAIPQPPPFAPFPNREYSQITLAPKETVNFDAGPIGGVLAGVDYCPL